MMIAEVQMPDGLLRRVEVTRVRMRQVGWNEEAPFSQPEIRTQPDWDSLLPGYHVEELVGGGWVAIERQKRNLGPRSWLSEDRPAEVGGSRPDVPERDDLSRF